jgi:hypothetical protein
MDTRTRWRSPWCARRHRGGKCPASGPQLPRSRSQVRPRKRAKTAALRPRGPAEPRRARAAASAPEVAAAARPLVHRLGPLPSPAGPTQWATAEEWVACQAPPPCSFRASAVMAALAGEGVPAGAHRASRQVAAHGHGLGAQVGHEAAVAVRPTRLPSPRPRDRVVVQRSMPLPLQHGNAAAGSHLRGPASPGMTCHDAAGGHPRPATSTSMALRGPSWASSPPRCSAASRSRLPGRAGTPSAI